MYNQKRMDQERGDKTEDKYDCELASRVDQSRLRWFKHIERMEVDCFLKIIYKFGAKGLRFYGIMEDHNWVEWIS